MNNCYVIDDHGAKKDDQRFIVLPRCVWYHVYLLVFFAHSTYSALLKHRAASLSIAA